MNFKKFIETIKIFSFKCPKCNSILDDNNFDSDIEKTIYTCKKCDREFILL